MAVPPFEALMLPLLRVHEDGEPRWRRVLRACLTQTGLLERTGRGRRVKKIRPHGEAVLGEAPAGIDIEHLKQRRLDEDYFDAGWAEAEAGGDDAYF